jgi:hypothetical protein
MHLIYSPDDNGYYYERFSDWKTSQVFRTEEKAELAKKNNKLKFD